MSAPIEDVSTSAPTKRKPAPKKGPTPRRTTAPAKKAASAAAPAEELLPNAFNLDDLEREGGKEAFAFIHNGRQYVLTDPQEQDWQRLVLVVQNPVQFLRLVLRPEDRDAFFENSMPTWKLRALTEAYQKHFGMGELGESAGLSV
jgi:hypothetical protein